MVSVFSMLEETLKGIRGTVNEDMQQALSKCVVELQVSLPLDKANMQSYGN